MRNRSAQEAQRRSFRGTKKPKEKAKGGGKRKNVKHDEDVPAPQDYWLRPILNSPEKSVKERCAHVRGTKRKGRC